MNKNVEFLKTDIGGFNKMLIDSEKIQKSLMVRLCKLYL